jgi:two-component system sensor histidine kinase/response regulator
MTSASLNLPNMTDKTTLRVLMVEDDSYYFEFVRQLLLRRTAPRFELSKAVSLKEAIAFLKEEIPDIILLDLHLPDTKGLVSLATLKEHSESCPIIVLTSADDDALGLKAVASGAHDYLVKQSVSNESLVRCIRYAIERRRAEEQVLRLAVIQDFIATLAHDMRVPLLGADKVLDAILAGTAGPLGAEQEQLIIALKESNSNQLALVSRLLEIYEYESGTSQLSLVSINLPNLIESAIARLQLQSPRQVLLKNHLPDSESMVNADEQAFERLLANLLDNAIIFSDEKDPITVTVSAQGTKVAIKIHNHGPAIPQEVQANLFQKFWSGVPGKRYVAHTGLGLYLCHRIVQLHHGRIACHSDDIDGTTISVILPA